MTGKLPKSSVGHTCHMRGISLRRATLIATVGLLAACSSPATLDDLSASSYSSTDAVMADLNCSERQT